MISVMEVIFKTFWRIGKLFGSIISTPIVSHSLYICMSRLLTRLLEKNKREAASREALKEKPFQPNTEGINCKGDTTKENKQEVGVPIMSSFIAQLSHIQ